MSSWLERLFEEQFVKDGLLAQSPRESRDFWILREGISESLSHQGLVHKNDIALPISNLELFLEEMPQVFSRQHPDLEIFLFGHIGDGNLHVNTLKPSAMSKEQFVELCHRVDLDLFELLRRYQGSVSAEHGIGLLKKAALSYTRMQPEIQLMQAMKKVFDPLGLLNPGKIFPLSKT